MTLTNLFISSYRGYCYQIWSVKTPPWYKFIGHFFFGGSNIITFWYTILKHLLISSYRGAIGLRSSTQKLKSSSTSCFKYLEIIKFSKFCKKDKCFHGSWHACRLWYLYIKQANWSKGNLSTNFLFLKFFSDTNTYFKSSHQSCSIKKQFLKLLEYSQETPVLEYLFNKVAGIQDCCKTYLLHSHLRLYFFR